MSEVSGPDFRWCGSNFRWSEAHVAHFVGAQSSMSERHRRESLGISGAEDVVCVWRSDVMSRRRVRVAGCDVISTENVGVIWRSDVTFRRVSICDDVINNVGLSISCDVILDWGSEGP